MHTLNKYSEKDHQKGSRLEDFFERIRVFKNSHQWKSDSSTQSSIRHDELFSFRNGLDSASIHDCREDIDANESNDDTKIDGPKGEFVVIDVLFANSDNAKEKENDYVRQCCHGLDPSLNRGDTLLGYVFESVPLLGYAATYETDDSRPVDGFCTNETEVGRGEDHQGFHNWKNDQGFCVW